MPRKIRWGLPVPLIAFNGIFFFRQGILVCRAGRAVYVMTMIANICSFVKRVCTIREPHNQPPPAGEETAAEGYAGQETPEL